MDKPLKIEREMEKESDDETYREKSEFKIIWKGKTIFHRLRETIKRKI